MKRKRILAAIMAGAMMLSSVPAFANTVTEPGHNTTSGELEGVTNPTIQVALPLNLSFSANPFGIVPNPVPEPATVNIPAFGQLYVNQFDIQNDSNVYVRVTLDLNLVTGTGVTIGNNAAGTATNGGNEDAPSEHNTNPDYTNKHGSFALILPQAVTHADGLRNTVTNLTRAGETNNRRVDLTSTLRTAQVGFILAPGAEGTPDASRLATFAFAAALNPYAAWAPGDINIGGTFGITPITNVAAIGTLQGDGTGSHPATDALPANNSIVGRVPGRDDVTGATHTGHRRIASNDLPAPYAATFGFRSAAPILNTVVTPHHAIILDGTDLSGALTIPFMGLTEATAETVGVYFEGGIRVPGITATHGESGTIVIPDEQAAWLGELPPGSPPISYTIWAENAGEWVQLTLTIRY